MPERPEVLGGTVEHDLDSRLQGILAIALLSITIGGTADLM